MLRASTKCCESIIVDNNLGVQRDWSTWDYVIFSLYLSTLEAGPDTTGREAIECRFHCRFLPFLP
jgi:hypothetical protein